MRGTFTKRLLNLAEQDSRIVLLTGDLGFMVLEPFAEKFPDRFYNIGVAEQNMVGIATGLAEAGFIPFVYSITTFATLRPYEFIRNGPILHKLPVRIVAVGGGFEYGAAGPTHHGVDDVGVMRVQPGITVVAPADYQQTDKALLATWDMPGPVYYRLGKNDKLSVPGLSGRFELGQAQVVRDGADVLLIAMGSITAEVVATADLLQTQGIEATVAVIASINPAPIKDIASLLKRFKVALTIEAHYINGGVGSLVSEVAAEHNTNCRIVRCGVEQSSNGISGDEASMHRLHGLDRDSLVNKIINILRKQ